MIGSKGDNTTRNAKNFFEGGFIEFEANGLVAHVELESTVNLDQDISYSGSLTPSPIPLGAFIVSRCTRSVLATD